MSVIEISKQARQLFRARRYDQAREMFRSGLAREPDNPYLLSGMGDACREIGDFDEAERCYRKLLDSDRKNLFALRGLGDVCKKLNRHQEAIRHWRSYLELRPRDKHVMTRIADSCKSLVQYDKAEEMYAEILRLEPQDRFALTGIADLYHRLGRDEEAIRYYEKVLQFDANELHILTIIGKLCWRINDFDKAENYFRRALKIDPHNPYALYGLGNCYRWHRNYAKAIEIWQEILVHSEGTQVLFTRLGDAYVNMGDFEQGEINYRKSLEFGYDGFSQIGLIRVHSFRGEFEAARLGFQRVVQEEKNLPQLLEDLSRRYVREGRREEMLGLFRYLIEKGDEQDPSLNPVRDLLAKLESPA